MNRLLIALLAILTGLGAPASAGASVQNCAEVELVQAAQVVSSAAEQHMYVAGMENAHFALIKRAEARPLSLGLIPAPRVYFGADRAFE